MEVFITAILNTFETIIITIVCIGNVIGNGNIIWVWLTNQNKS